MRDSYIKFEDGRWVPVSELTDSEIAIALTGIWEPHVRFADDVTREQAAERLRIEIVARSLR